VFRRRVRAEAKEGFVWAGVEDDLHHFEVELEHNGREVTAARGRAIRFPWTICPGAAERVGQFVGHALDARLAIDARQECTHLLDLAKFALAQAVRGGTRQYDVTLPDRVQGRTTAELRRDGELIFAWQFQGFTVTAPDLFAGIDVNAAIRWPREIMADPDLLEAALMLRRGVFVSNIRAPAQADFRDGTRPSSPGDEKEMDNVCFAHQAVRAFAGRIAPGYRDFSGQPEELLNR
jgi:hypothetical protein